MECIICRDNYDFLNKICICNDCNICDNCLHLSNINKLVKCPNCRRNLEITLTYDYLRLFRNIAIQILIQLLIFFIPFILFIYKNTEDIDNEEFIYIVVNIVVCLLVLEPISLVMFEKYLGIKFKIYQSYKSLAIIIVSSFLIYFLSKITFLVFLLYILIPFYYMPLIISASFFISNLMKQLYNYNKSIIIRYNIKVKQILSIESIL